MIEISTRFMYKTIPGLLDTIQQITKADSITLTLLAHSEAHPSLPSIQVSWEGNLHIPDYPLDLENTLIQQALTQGAAIHQIHRATLSLMILPILIENRAIGHMNLAWQSDAPLSFDRLLITLMAQQLGLTLETIRLNEVQQTYIQALEYLSNFAIELASLPTIDAVLEGVGLTIRVLFNVKGWAVRLAKDSAAYAESLSDNLKTAIGSVDPTEYVTSAPNHPFEATHVAIFANQTLGSETLPFPAAWQAAFDQAEIHICILALLHQPDEIMGCLVLLYDDPYIPISQDIRLLELLSSQVSIALRHITLNASSEAHTQLLEAHIAERTRALNVAREKAESADHFKSDLISLLSHELRTPLAVIKAHATTISSYYDRLPKERHIEYLHTIDEETDRLTSMVNSLTDMSRLESGDLALRMTQIEPVSLMKQFAHLFEDRYSNHSIEFFIPPSLDMIYADPERLWQIFTNLLENADKYSPEDSPFEIGARAWEDGIEFWVRDHGEGLLPHQLQKIFDLFYQVENSQQFHLQSGVGLGLAICKGLVEGMGGHIWCESAGLKQGCKFAFTIPWQS